MSSRRGGADALRRIALCGVATAAMLANFDPARADAVQKTYGRTPAESSPPSWPRPRPIPAGAPNVLIIMTDDVGFGAASGFGGPIPTPAFDALARGGLRYNNFNTTAICSPTRASLLTGRYPQNVGMGYTANWPSGYDGYNSVIPKSAGTIAEVLKQAGYNTAMFGKGHITPEWEMSSAGPFDRWPTGLGFEYFYGFLGADVSAFEPALIENTRPVDPPRDPDYHLDKDLADRAIDWIAEQKSTAPDRPFFVYYAPGSAHAPSHAPRAWLEKFRGRFDQGWDVLRAETLARQKALGVIPADTADAPRPAALPRWDSLTADQKRLYSRHMEAYAAQLAYADAQIGRLLDSLKASGEFDDTLVIYIQGDNGASAEGGFDGKLFEQSPLAGVPEDPAYALAHLDDIGGPAAYNLIPGGWGWAMNAPFPWSKRYASHFGGVRNGMVLSWPSRTPDPGGLRAQVMHVSDIMPTVLEAAGIEAPRQLNGVAQQPITGVSQLKTLASPKAPSPRTTMVFGMAQNLSLYKDGWVAATTPMVTPWERTPVKPVPLDERRWELYDIGRDFSQARDLAAVEPRRLEEMKALYWAEAAKAGILPIHSSEGAQGGRPDVAEGRTEFAYAIAVSRIPETAAPHVVGKSFTITARVVVPPEGARGVICAHGGRYGGYSLAISGGRPVFIYSLTPAHVTRVEAPAAMTAGAHELRVRVQMDAETPGAPANVTLLVDGKAAATGRVAKTFLHAVSHTEGFDVGQDATTPVDARYAGADTRFVGGIEKVTFQIDR